MINSLIYLLIVLFILGVLAFFVDRAPFISATFKQLAQFALIAAGAIVLIYFLLGLVNGGGLPNMGSLGTIHVG
jgi:hypothetical protein